MKKANNIEQLAPTFVEKPLVMAVANHRDEWPYIYLEMKKVTKEDLLLDAEYCARHKHPSMTNFYEECGKISGIHISMLRKIQRAGTYYESAKQRHAELPEITYSGVCDLSPDTLTLVAKIVHLIGRGGAKTESQKDVIERLLLEGLVEGEGLSRKQLNSWYEYLDDSIYSDSLDEAAKKFYDELQLWISGKTEQSKAAPRSFHVRARSAIARGSWLKTVASSDLSIRPRLRLEEMRNVSDGSSPCSALIVLEAVNNKLTTHAMVLCESTLGAQGVHALELKDILVAKGFDYVWIIFGLGDNDLSSTDAVDFGLIHLTEDEAEVLSAAPKLHAAPGAQRDLYASILLQSIENPEAKAVAQGKKRSRRPVPMILLV